MYVSAWILRNYNYVNVGVLLRNNYINVIIPLKVESKQLEEH